MFTAVGVYKDGERLNLDPFVKNSQGHIPGDLETAIEMAIANYPDCNFVSCGTTAGSRVAKRTGAGTWSTGYFNAGAKRARFTGAYQVRGTEKPYLRQE